MPKCCITDCQNYGIYGFHTIASADGATTSNANNIYCSLHRPEGSVNVISRICAEPGCTKRPTYSIPGTKKSTILRIA
jgi:hypothetical protein